MALQELGVPLDLLAQAGAQGQKAAKAVQTFMWSGNFEFKAAADKGAREKRNQFKHWLRDLLSQNQ